MYQQLRQLFSEILHTAEQRCFPRKTPNDHYVMVLSGGGTKGFYTLWILKALEEAGLKDKVDAIYGISAWAIVGAYRAAWRSATQIFERLTTLPITASKRINLLPLNHLLKTTPLQKYLKEDLPTRFEDLNIKTYIWAVDIYIAKLIFFNKGHILEPLLGTMAIPGVFPNVHYQKHLLSDGGIINNFPIAIAKKDYPTHKIIGVALNTFRKNQTPKNVIEMLMLSLEIAIRKDMVAKSDTVDILFREDIDCKALETNKKKWEKAFKQGYASGIKEFKVQMC